MSSKPSQADTIRSSIASASTCTSATSTLLKELLQSRQDDVINEPSKPPSRTVSRKTTQAISKTKISAQEKKQSRSTSSDQLTPKERASLATEVINITLKALGEAAKAPAPPKTAAVTSASEQPKPARRAALRRSLSAPPTPLQPRPLNRVSTSPVEAKQGASNPSHVSTGCLALVECARTAFVTLRSLQASGAIPLPEFQLETGILSFVSRLIGLKLFDHAAKDLRILKKRLEGMATDSTNKKPTATTTSTTAKTLSDLLDFPVLPGSETLRALVINSQLHALRILIGLRKLTHLDASLPFLRQSNPSSPSSLLLSSLRDEKCDRAKVAKQLDVLSQILLTLAPSVAPKDDGVAQEPRLSPSPEAALEVQILALIVRLESWSVSGHEGDIEKNVLHPLAVCLGAFKRRSSHENAPILVNSFNQVWAKLEKSGLRVSASSDSSLSSIYQLLANTSRESGKSTEAEKWTVKWRALTNPQRDSVAKCCAVTAQLLALSLKDPHDVNEDLYRQILEGMQGTLSGSVAELDDLLSSICLLRKAVTSIITKHPICALDICSASRQLLESFLAQLPRFTCRWLGVPPDSSSATKDRLRFEQRRQLLAKYRNSILDSALLLVKTQLDEDRSLWETTDLVLQESLNLLANTEQIGPSATQNNPSNSYHVKISTLYYQQHLKLQKSTLDGDEASSLRALRKSVDSVKLQPEAEQARAQLFIKWERYASLCQVAGRREKAADALRSLRDHLVREEVVEAVTSNLATHSVAQSWKLSPEAELLSRTVCNLAQLDRKGNDWTWLLVDEHKATALEHDLYFIFANDCKPQHSIELSDPLVSKLLHHHTDSTYPIRRMRVLLLLISASIDAQEQSRILQQDLTKTLAIVESGELGKDSGLANYVPYLRHYTACITSLISGQLESGDIQRAVSGLKLLSADCRSLDQLNATFDDPLRLLKMLQSLADLARIRGRQNLLTDLTELCVMISQLTVTNNVELHVSNSVALCLHYLALGRSSKADSILSTILDKVTPPHVSDEVISDFHLSAAEYHLAVGCIDQAEQHLVKAHETGAAEVTGHKARRRRHTNNKMAVAYASFLTSNLAQQKGENHRALLLAKTAVKMLLRDWEMLEQRRSFSSDVTMDDSSRTISSEEDTSMTDSSATSIGVSRSSTGPEFWAIVYPLFRFVSRLSLIYAHIGMYQETMHYAEQALKVANSMDSPSFIAQATTWMASISFMAGDSTKSIKLAMEATPMLLASEPTYDTITAICQAASVCQDAHDTEFATELINKAGLMLQELKACGGDEKSSSSDILEKELSKLTLKEAKPTKARTRVQSAATKTTRVSKKPAPKKSSTKETQQPGKRPTTPEGEDILLNSIQACVLQLQSMTHLENKDWTAAIASLRSAAQVSQLSSDFAQEQYYLGLSLIGQGLEQMGSDAVFSLIQDSTLSFPAIATAIRDKHVQGQSPQVRTSPAGKIREASQITESFVENLQHAQEHLLDAHSIARVNGNGALIHRIAVALQNVAILLLNTDTSNTGAGHPAYATCSIEMARNLIWRRERKANRHEHQNHANGGWPVVIDSSDHKRHSLGPSLDMHQFHREYVNIIPKAWNVVSISLSENKHDLCITKLQAGHSPFALRLPLERANSRDADNEIFDFQQGRSELVEIIQAINRSCHQARDMREAEAKSTWWTEREELDERLKQLLDNMEESWLGGFKGIFSQHYRRSDLLARFQRSFQNILDKYLPSRRQIRGKRAKANVAKVNLDPRILDLFIGLGDATVPDCDLDEPLNDLLYFVVDVLQFHGELNAYDEIDFDAMVVDTFDALHSYHAVAKSTKGLKSEQDGAHTILVMDKSLHAFPWEALPCLRGLAVSRVPSLDCLRRLILESQALASPTKGSLDANSDDDLNTCGSLAGHYASINSGTYILNPGEDLVNTQATFGQALASLPPTWSSIETREPSEAEFHKTLAERDILLYFGHGSGAQYIRTRTIRQMEKCRATALLMGCSSASLTHAGDFEPYGPVWNYMLAGAPAVVGTLWDVTDRDIDRFAGCMFEEWGLLPRGTFVTEHSRDKGKGKGRAKAAVSAARKRGAVTEDGKGSLVEAVAKARVGACRLKYLTAAAVCVYGIPVYIAK